MSNIISVTSTSIEQLVSEQRDEVLPGLSKKSYGFVIGNPGAGKGYFFLSLAYELTTNIKLLGLSKQSAPIKVLYWPIEDGVNTVAARIKKHLHGISDETAELIEQNFSLYNSFNPICSRRNDAHLSKIIESNRSELIKAALDYDLLIIDTIREASGSCHEVEDDQSIKVTLQEVARSADVAILVSHHPTKDVMRKKEVLTTVSGSGLSVTQANSRYSIFIDTVDNKKEKTTQISHLKHNNVIQEDVITNKKVHWDSNSLMFIDDAMLSDFKSNGFTEVINESHDVKVDWPEPVKELTPKSIDFDDVIIIDKNIDALNQNAAVDDNTIDDFADYLANQEKE